MRVWANRVKETATVTGTDAYQLGGATTAHQGFVAGWGDGNGNYYIATDGTDWEVNDGAVTDAAPDTLARGFLSSSTGAQIVWPAATAVTIVAYNPAENMDLLANIGQSDVKLHFLANA